MGHVDKEAVELHVYVTDARGIVVYDSDQGREEGHDFSQWRDVNRALQGRYGARASRRDRTDSFSAVFYVALPIRRGDEVVGALAVGKQAQAVKGLLAALNRKIALAGLIALGAAVALSVAGAGSPGRWRGLASTRGR